MQCLVEVIYSNFELDHGIFFINDILMQCLVEVIYSNFV